MKKRQWGSNDLKMCHIEVETRVLTPARVLLSHMTPRLAFYNSIYLDSDLSAWWRYSDKDRFVRVSGFPTAQTPEIRYEIYVCYRAAQVTHTSIAICIHVVTCLQQSI
jgi:hypothetical protein